MRKNANDKIVFFESLPKSYRATVQRDLAEAKNDLLLALFNEVSAISEKGDKEKALLIFEKSFNPYKKQFESLYNEVIADGTVDKNDEIKLMNQLNFLNEFIGVAAEVDTIYAKQQQDVLYKIVGQ